MANGEMLTCDHCGKEFWRSSNQIAAWRSQGSVRKYCSRACHTDAQIARAQST